MSMARSGPRVAAGLAAVVALLVASLWLPPTAVAESPIGKWKTVDDKTGQVRSEVDIYEQDGKLFGKIIGLTEPTDRAGNPKRCVKCPGADRDKPIVGLVIIRDLSQKGDRYTDGTIMDPEDGKVYKAEIWVEDGKLKVRGYLGVFYKTQTWLRAA